MYICADKTVVQVEPPLHTANVGSRVKFYCLSNLTALTWTFERYSGTRTGLPYNAKMRLYGQNVTLDIKNVRMGNAGYYFCYNFNPIEGFFEDRALLKVGKNLT